MGFLNDISNYKTLQSDYYLTDELPDNFWDEFHAYAARTARKIGTKKTVNLLNDIALLPPTTNWGESFLQEDLDNSIWKIRQKAKDGDFPLAMDAVRIIVEEGGLDTSEINGWLQRNRIGYSLLSDGFRHYFWEIRESVDDITSEIEDASKMVKPISRQALEHLEQARKQLEAANSERARKNAVRDCASAMETIIKQYGRVNDIGEASKALRKTGDWGKDEIVKDGNSIFSTLHRLYPDFRHGSTEISAMTEEEAIYWVDRMMAYVKYMIRKSKSLGAEKGDFDF